MAPVNASGVYWLMRIYVSAAVLLSILRATAALTDPLQPWEFRHPPDTLIDLANVIFAQDQFVAVGNRGVVRTSMDGSNWTTRATGTTVDLADIAYGNGLFAAVATDGSVH